MSELTRAAEGGLHLTQPRAAERSRLVARLVRERAWSHGLPRYADNEEVWSAIAAGELVRFPNNDDLQPIMRFRSDRDSIPYMSRQAVGGAMLFGQEWRATLRGLFNMEVPDIRLAVTSMVRSQARQDVLVAEGALAVPNSTHCTGHTFDIDNSGYYALTSNGFASVTDPRRTARKQQVGQALADKLGAIESPSSEGLVYDPRIMVAAAMAANVLHNAYVINIVPEHTGTENACLHIAVNPEHQF